MNPETLWWLEHTSEGRKMQRKMLPPGALLPRARADHDQERREEEERAARARRTPGRGPRG